MLIPELGAIYYAPYNVYGIEQVPNGELISTENQASTLSGILMLRSILLQKKIYLNIVADIENLAKNIIKFIKSAYDPGVGWFRQGGYYNATTKQFTWQKIFAVDCQTWTMTVLGSKNIDTWFGKDTSLKIWENTKAIAGYKFNGSMAKGLGFGRSDSIFSGEWTFGALNMLKVFMNESGYDNAKLSADFLYMRQGIEEELTKISIINNLRVDTVLYANKRYWIPFGWWSNPIPSLASTGWAALVDSSYNPLYLGGDYYVYELLS